MLSQCITHLNTNNLNNLSFELFQCYFAVQVPYKANLFVITSDFHNPRLVEKKCIHMCICVYIYTYVEKV